MFLYEHKHIGGFSSLTFNKYVFILKLKLSKTNRLIIDAYKPPSINDITFISEIRNILTFDWSLHDEILLMEDFNLALNDLKLYELIVF